MANTASAPEIPVSVVIPAYNAHDTIVEALQSVRAQTVRPREILVVDDGSTDGTRDLVRQRFPDVAVLSNAHGGPSSARNAGVNSSSSPWIAFLDADDVWAPTKLETQLVIARSSSDVGLVYVGWDRPGRQLSSPKEGRALSLDFLQVLSGYFIGPSGVLASREAILDAGGFRPERDGIEDRDLWSRLALRKSVIMMQSVLWSYRRSARHAPLRRRAGFLAGLALLDEMHEVVGARSGPLGWEVLVAYQALRYRFYFRRDGNRDGDAACRDLLSKLPPQATRWTWQHLFIPYLARRVVSRAAGRDGSGGEFLPSRAALWGPRGPLPRHPGGQEEADRGGTDRPPLRPDEPPAATEGHRWSTLVRGDVAGFEGTMIPCGGALSGEA